MSTRRLTDAKSPEDATAARNSLMKRQNDDIESILDALNANK
jgi:hypothetical protein